MIGLPKAVRVLVAGGPKNVAAKKNRSNNFSIIGPVQVAGARFELATFGL